MTKKTGLRANSSSKSGNQKDDSSRPHQGHSDFRLAFLHALFRLSHGEGVNVEHIYGPALATFPPLKAFCGPRRLNWVPNCLLAPEFANSSFESPMRHLSGMELVARGFVEIENRRLVSLALHSSTHGSHDFQYRTSLGERVRVCFVKEWMVVLLPDRFPKRTSQLPSAARALLNDELKRSPTLNETCQVGRATGAFCAASRMDVDQKHFKLTPLGLQTMFPWPEPIPFTAIPQADWRVKLLARLNTTEGLIVEAVFRNPGIKGEQIANKIAGQRFNPSFRSILSALRRMGVLHNHGRGSSIETDFSEPVREWLSHSRKSGQGPD